MDSIQMLLGLNKQNNPNQVPEGQSILGPTVPKRTDDTTKFSEIFKLIGVLQEPKKMIPGDTEGSEVQDPTDDTSKISRMLQIIAGM